MYRRPSQVQLMRGEFLETALYWAGVVSVRLGGIAEKKVSQHYCVWVLCGFDSQSISCVIRRLELMFYSTALYNGPYFVMFNLT